MATYNGSKHVYSQIKSLTDNTTPFTLHWLDDHSRDNTRETVRNAASSLGVRLVEWHQPQHQGVPGAFFQLLECVEADIYLFCDQDDIWQPGKIDVTATNLIPDVTLPVLCFSDPLIFHEDRPDRFIRVSHFWNIKRPEALHGARCLILTPAPGQSIGLTRPLRDMFICHSPVARKYASMHSNWMFLIAGATGITRMLTNAPTTLYRQHGDNVSGPYYRRTSGLVNRLVSKWNMTHSMRQRLAWQAQGFSQAAMYLPPGPKLDPFLSLAPLVAKFHQRQSVLTLLSLAVRGIIVPSAAPMLWIAAACLWTDAKEA